MTDYNAQLFERAKELECMYMVDEVLQNEKLTLPAVMKELVTIIPVGFTLPEACRIQITLWNEVFAEKDFSRATVLHSAPLMAGEEGAGELTMGYICEQLEHECQLVSNEIKLLNAIARRISTMTLDKQKEISLMFDMLRSIDPEMLLRIGEKMRIYLKKTVGTDADHLFDEINLQPSLSYGEVNTPMAKPVAVDGVALRKKLIAGATAFLPQGNMYELISSWIQEQRIIALVRVVDSKNASISDILDAVRKYNQAVDTPATPVMTPTETWLVAELAHRFLANDEKVLNLILDNLSISDFESVLERIIGSNNSKGSIGGKGAGLFIAKQILRHKADEDPLLRNIKTPRTWYLATDQMVDFLHYNNLEELNFYKYNTPFTQRFTYDSVVSRIKNAMLPPQTVKMLHVVLEEMGDIPIIVRSSSLLEDRRGDAFSGKYKSLFLPNRGSRIERLDALVDAILEVYSSMYNPDAIQYRRERSLLNINEQMGILIQEVVGHKAGKYFLPAFSGVAFSHNLLRWSPRIKREDGLVRMVMGLGTRAVDRVKDDYPLLFSLGQPRLSINQTPADVKHYSPKYIDLINLEENRFETVNALSFLKEVGQALPELHKYVSVINDDFVEHKNAFSLDTQRDEMAITFHHILNATDIPEKLKHILDGLSEKMDTPVDIEFAYDGKDLYLLQCRPQGSGLNTSPAPIPQNLKPRDIIFSGNRYISNALIQGITHVVYVDGEGYHSLTSLKDLYAVGEAVGHLNGMLPRRKYILIGPGRWGSRGDIRLGVRVTFSDISGTAALIEIAREKHAYAPEVSFGTHFFQDLVESGIVYLPLYPDQKGIVFKEGFLKNSKNSLGTILPQYEWLSDTIKVIDVPASYYGQTLSIHMNSDLEQAVAFLTDEEQTTGSGAESSHRDKPIWQARDQQEHWQWRYFMAQQIAESMDMEALGVEGVYLIGSTSTGETGMGSDIDLLLHITDQDVDQKRILDSWLDGWSRALAKINYLQTGYTMDKLLDVHMVTDKDIKDGNSFAIKITSLMDPATPLRLLES